MPNLVASDYTINRRLFPASDMLCPRHIIVPRVVLFVRVAGEFEGWVVSPCKRELHLHTAVRCIKRARPCEGAYFVEYILLVPRNIRNTTKEN